MRQRAPYIEERTTEDLENCLERTKMAIACCVWETDWTKDMRTYQRRLEAELDSRYHAALDPQEIAFQTAKEESES